MDTIRLSMEGCRGEVRVEEEEGRKRRLEEETAGEK